MRDRFVTAIFAVVLVSAALYFGRIELEPVAFVLFAMALVEPFQRAAEVRTGKTIALLLTFLFTLLATVIGSGIAPLAKREKNTLRNLVASRG